MSNDWTGENRLGIKLIMDNEIKNNGWIEWNERAPTEKDLPIECADYGTNEPYIWLRRFIPRVSPLNRKYDLWRPYICDIPSKPRPQPDANGWWKMEDKKPSYCEPIKFRLRKLLSTIFIGVVGADNLIFSCDNIPYETVNFSDISTWAPLDMTGPEEK